MILYNKFNQRVHCIKCNPPRFKYFDYIKGYIDDVETNFWFSMKNNSSYYYFSLFNQWYKTYMVTEDGISIFTMIEKKNERLFTTE